MIRFVLYDERIQIPNWVVDLESFRRWSDDDAFPETGQISFLKGDVWVEQLSRATLRFDILRWIERGYLAGRKRSGWSRSEVFDRWFRLTRQLGTDGFPQFTVDAQTQRPR